MFFNFLDGIDYQLRKQLIMGTYVLPPTSNVIPKNIRIKRIFPFLLTLNHQNPMMKSLKKLRAF